MRHPMQPIQIDPKGTIRFQENAIVRTLLDFAGPRGLDMNELLRMKFSQTDRTQFAQLIGYSVSGFHDLPYVSDEDAFAASEAARQLVPDFAGCRDAGCLVHLGVETERSE